jgi:predicted DCC family thiol-disulfide oxidoreductase YuxK
MNLILFDGVCELCNGVVQFVIKRDKRSVFKFASLQSEAGKEILRKNGVDPERIDSVLFYDGTRIYSKSEAIFMIAQNLRGFRWLRIFSFLPRNASNFIYDLIAKNRYRIWGKRDSCMIPSHEIKRRFLS